MAMMTQVREKEIRENFEHGDCMYQDMKDLLAELDLTRSAMETKDKLIDYHESTIDDLKEQLKERDDAIRYVRECAGCSTCEEDFSNDPCPFREK